MHQWFCELNDDANECRDIQLETSALERLADKLEQWVDDPKVLPPVTEQFRGPFFGVREGDEDYEEARDIYRGEATDEVKQIRKAIAWLKQPHLATGGRENEYRFAVYKVSW